MLGYACTVSSMKVTSTALQARIIMETSRYPSVQDLENTYIRIDREILVYNGVSFQVAGTFAHEGGEKDIQELLAR